MENLSQQFSASDMIIAGEAWPGWRRCQRDPQLPPIHYVTYQWTWPKRGRGYLRWLRWLALPYVILRLVLLIRRWRCQTVVAVFPDDFYVIAAYWAGRLCGVPVYPYLHNTYLENVTGAGRLLAQWMQPRLFRDAPVVFVMSAGMRDYYQAKYPMARFEPLPHTFNEPIPDFTEPPIPGHPLRLGLLGNLNQSNLDATRRVVHLVRDDADMKLSIYSGSGMLMYNKMDVVGENVEIGPVPMDQVQSRLAENDILIIPHGFVGGLTQVEYETIFPTRTIPCLISGRPILAHTPPDCFFTRWLRQYDCAEIVDQADPGAIHRALERLRTDAQRRSHLVQNALHAARQFHAPAVAAAFRQTLRETAPS